MDSYDNPLISRYASREMSQLWGTRQRILIWRRLWVALAESEAELGLPISPQQLAELRSQLEHIDLDRAAEYERQLRHDVMAHVHAYADLCPEASKIIHWGATSCYVTDNADLILMRTALQMVRQRLVAVIDHLGRFAARYRDLACLAYTHLQPAQPTTVGKRACLWAYDLILDLRELTHRLDGLCLRGVKGTTGTQASFLALFGGDHEKVRQLEARVAAKMDFPAAYAVTGQTYPRKVDSQILEVLSGIAQSAHKGATDIRILASRRELEEPFEADQVGSSAMAYKRNPMRCERICSLSRYLISLPANAAYTAATQWMERTLDDSANRRLVIPQAFLAADAILILYQNVVAGLVVYPQIIAAHLREELPFMATENILMAAVQAGGDRQALHEKIRQHSQRAADEVKGGRPNDLLERLKQDDAFQHIRFEDYLNADAFVGRAPQQVDEFLQQEILPLRERFPATEEMTADVRV